MKRIPFGGRILVALALLIAGLVPLVGVGAQSYNPAAATAVWSTDGAGPVLAIANAGSATYIGGGFGGLVSPDGASSLNQPWLAALNANGDPIAGFTPRLDGEVRTLALSADRSVLYVGGAFRSANGNPAVGLVALDANTGATLQSFNTEVDNDVLDIAVDGNDLYIVGRFETANGTARKKMARVDAQSGALDTSWAPRAVAGPVWGVAVDSSSDRVYVAGFFSSIDDTPGTYGLAALERSSGTVVSEFVANPGVEVYDVQTTAGKVYAALGGPGGRLEIYNATNGSLRASWIADGDLQAIEVAGDKIYVGGHHDALGTATAPWVAEIDAVTDQINPDFDPSIEAASGVGIWALAASDSHLWIGGEITAASPVSGVGVLRYARSSDAPVDTSAPSTPGTPSVDLESDISVHLSWGPSTDNSGPVGYEILRDGVQVGSSVTNSWVDASVAPNTIYNYSVRAIDPAGNRSAASANATATTRPLLTELPAVAFGSTWRYDDSGRTPPAAWADNGFDDSAWKSGAAVLGVNEGGEATELPVLPTVRFRSTFDLEPNTRVVQATLRYQRDDGALALINGVEVDRNNLPAGTITNDTAAVDFLSSVSEREIVEVNVDPSVFSTGSNTLAFSVHNAPGSVDMRFDAELVLRTERSDDWQLVWSDEFNGNQLDPAKWNVEFSSFGRSTGALQCMTPDNVIVANGTLSLQARQEPTTCAAGASYDYSSGMINSRGLGEWTYGRFEIRARVPQGQGLWSAIWSGSADNAYGRWPASGEFDVVEVLGQESNRAVATAHWGDNPPSNRSNGSLTLQQSLADDFHVYAMEWEEGEMRWYLDDQLYHTSSTADGWFAPGTSNVGAPFDQSIFMRLSLYVGGRWPGDPDATTPFPANFSVDYVRVYQDPTAPNTPAPPPDNPPVVPPGDDDQRVIEPPDGDPPVVDPPVVDPPVVDPPVVDPPVVDPPVTDPPVVGPPPGDRTRPRITLDDPQRRDRVNSPVVVSGTATDNQAVDRVEVVVFDHRIGQFWNGTDWQWRYIRLPAQLTGADWQFVLDIAPGRYWIGAYAIDTSGNTSPYADTYVLVDQPAPETPPTGTDPPGTTTPPTKTTPPTTEPPSSTEPRSDNTRPTMTLDSPERHSTVMGPVTTASGSASDDQGIDRVALAVQRDSDAKWWNGTDWQANYILFNAAVSQPGERSVSWSWTLNDAPDSYWIGAYAFDAAGNRSNESGVYFHLETNDVAIPTVSLDSPQKRTTVEGDGIEALGQVADDRGVDRVEIALQRDADAKWWNGSTWQREYTHVEAELSTEADGNLSWSFDLEVSPDSYWIGVYAFDQANNRSGLAKAYFHLHPEPSTS